jgi:hypothetical protein
MSLWQGQFRRALTVRVTKQNAHNYCRSISPAVVEFGWIRSKAESSLGLRKLSFMEANMPFLTNIGNQNIEQHEIKRKDGLPYLSVEASGIGVLHTTEGSLSAALTVFERDFDPPHFLVGNNRIIQCRPLGARAASLRSNHYDSPNDNAQVQIEMVAFSAKQLWLPENGTLNGTLLIMAYCFKHFGIPLQPPDDGWPDDLSDMPQPSWASNNSRRQAAGNGLWPSAKGWWMHLEVPWQEPTWHWDCGALRRKDMLNQAAALVPSV